MIIGSRQRIASLEGKKDLSVNGTSLNRVKHSKFIVVHIDENLTLAEHVNNLTKKLRGLSIYFIRDLSHNTITEVPEVIFANLKHLLSL